MHAKTRDPEIARVLKTKPYWIWANMKARCTVSTAKAYKYYGGRGITICDEWKNSFVRFWKDMGNTYEEGLTIDRIDNYRGYERENCRWATWEEQRKNRRPKNTKVGKHLESRDNFQSR